MKKLVNGFLLSVSMFSIIPVPKYEWSPELLRFMLLFLPVAGALTGGIWAAVIWALRLFSFNGLIRAFLIMLAPFLLTGFLHMDGFCDTCDALFCGRDLETKRKILKDPNLGVFGGCALVLTFILWFICSISLLNAKNTTPLIICMSVSSRAVAALSVISLKSISENGLGALFKSHSKRFDYLFICAPALIGAGASYYFAGKSGAAFLFCVISATAAAALYSYRSLKGFSGDLAGFSIVCGETAGMIFFAILQ